MQAEQEKTENHSESQARIQLASIRTEVFRLKHCEECRGEDCPLTVEQILEGINVYDHEREQATPEEIAEYHDEDKARQEIEESPLSVEVRSDWHLSGEKAVAGEYRLLLCTGGPAVRIIGDLEDGEPKTARIQHQDWFKPWVDLPIDSDDEEALLSFARCFTFDE